MSIQVSSMVWSKGPKNLKERMVLLAIADHANDSGSAFPGIDLIAQKSCMDKRSVMRWLRVLEANGWMSIDHKSSGSGRKGNTYYLNLTKLGDVSTGTGLTDAAANVGPCKRTSRSELVNQTGRMTSQNSQVTKAQFSDDKTISPIWSNRQEPSKKPSGGTSPRSFKVGNAPAKNSRLPGLAADMLERLVVIDTGRTKHLAAEAIRLLAKHESKTFEEATMLIEERARIALQQGSTVNAFWFEDGKWKGVKASQAIIGVYRPDASSVQTAEIYKEKNHVVPSAEEVELGVHHWNEMKTAMKKALPVGKFETWVRPIRAVGAMQGVMVLELPSTDFEGVEVRLQFHKYLPPELTQVRCVIAETLAA